MKRKFFKIVAYSFAVVVMAVAIDLAYAGNTKNEVMIKKPDGTYIVITTTIAGIVKGYKGATPLMIYIKKDKVVKIEALQNMETPRYFDRVKQLILSSWDGMQTSKAAKKSIDCVAGATLSSNAVIETVKLGFKYYKENK